MLSRKTVLENIIQTTNEHSCIISPLGYISRDLYDLTTSAREQYFYSLGSMGCVIPLALGVSLSHPKMRVIALEGDGSLLMNLGALSTLYRYGNSNIDIMIFDNDCYESTGKQPSQPQNFRIEDVIKSVGFYTETARDVQQVINFTQTLNSSIFPRVLVLKVECEPSSSRIVENPVIIAQRFHSWLNKVNK
jgi:thiamine pyrophosphate-dependent acetolactate synthase large subunit-like protein